MSRNCLCKEWKNWAKKSFKQIIHPTLSLSKVQKFKIGCILFAIYKDACELGSCFSALIIMLVHFRLSCILYLVLWMLLFLLQNFVLCCKQRIVNHLLFTASRLLQRYTKAIPSWLTFPERIVIVEGLLILRVNKGFYKSAPYDKLFKQWRSSPAGKNVYLENFKNKINMFYVNRNLTCVYNLVMIKTLN